ncbi:type I-E CRISPR-associated protein Cas5/CasD [Stella sp.]|uniref:type I-E CRISPR-associated protein Cas5/CasD n=1 Tax=Stella sp. TaxID=2912054 RepID=UPI0035B1F55F
MPAFLVFTLYAPLAAFGDVAVGERRVAFDRPSRSGVLGLAAAALGIARNDEASHAALDAAYACAVRVDRAGTLLQDYHTVQAPPARAGRRWSTRAAALAEPGLGTLLSLRDYRQDALATIVLMARASGDAYGPERLAEALARPRFTLYAGRKACPLGLPPRPLVVEAEGLVAALARYDTEAPAPERDLRAVLSPQPSAHRTAPEPATIHADRDFAAAGGLSGLEPLRVEWRRDHVASRARWQFGLRETLALRPAEGSP